MPRETTTASQSIAENDVGDISQAFGSSVKPVNEGVTEDGTHDTAGDDAASRVDEPAPKPETALETIQRAQLTLDNAIAFARAKADAAVARVESVGGVLSKDMQAAVDKLRATIGD